MDNQHKLIKGYRDLSQSEIDSINSIKLAEQDIGQLWQQVAKVEGVDHRQLAIAKTKLQEAFMWFIRGVAQPLDVFTLEIPKETFLDRLRVERDDLNQKYKKLGSYLDTPPFYSLTEEAQSDLRLQYEVMPPYVFIINKRYDEATA
jgi:hypothetical protein